MTANFTMSDANPNIHATGAGPAMRLDLHCHSQASHDCLTPIATFPTRCRAQNITVQAITDHDEIWGALQLKEMVEAQPEYSGLTIIVGEEVTTSEGEIIGLFLQELIPPRLSPEETVAAIHEQGGLVLLPHGFDQLKRHRLKPPAVTRIAAEIDIVEVFNARISRPHWNRAAANWATERNLAHSSGTDSHTLRDIGSAWVETAHRPIREPNDLLLALRAGAINGKWVHPIPALAYKMFHHARSKFRRP